MKTNLTKADIPRRGDPITVDLGDDYSLRVNVERDDSQGPPWKECGGYGPVSEWTRRGKRPGEWVLCSDGFSKCFYDFKSAMREARKNRGLSDEHKTELAKELGRPPTDGEIAVEAVRRDFNLLKGWCDNEWEWVGVTVTLLDPDSRELGDDSLWGLESFGEYWRECAAEMGTELIERHLKEIDEAAYWAERDVMTGAPVLAN